MAAGGPTEIPSRRSSAIAALMLVAIGLNIAINFGERHAGLPVVLGRFGTVLAGALGGPWVGGAVGASSNVIYGLAIHSESLPYAIVNGLIGMVVGSVAPWFGGPVSTLGAACVVVVVETLASLSVGAVVYGVHGSGAHVVTAVLLMTLRNLRHYGTTAQFGMDVADKVLTCYIVFFIRRILSRRPAIRHAP